MVNDHLRNLANTAMRDAQALAQRNMLNTQNQLIANETRQRQTRTDQSTARAETQLIEQTELLAALNTLSEEQAQTLAAMSKASREQVQTLGAMRQLSEDLAGERRRSAAREDRQQAFNKGMTILASVLAGAAVIIPFGILWIEQALK